MFQGSIAMEKRIKKDIYIVRTVSTSDKSIKEIVKELIDKKKMLQLLGGGLN
jgi:transcription antitermination factor NusG